MDESNAVEAETVWPRFAVPAAAFVAVLAAPTPSGLTPVAQRLAAVVVLMAAGWVLRPVPMAATSLIPLAAFPLLGIQTAKDVSQSYIDENVFLFLGGFLIAMGIEKWGLHRRISLHVLRVIGGSPRRIVLGFLLATAFVSMWISNTATTLLMLPIGVAVLRSIRDLVEPDAEGADPQPALARLETALMLTLAYASTIGGFTTLVGTATNVAFQKAWKAAFPAAPELAAGEWMAMFVPLGLVFLFAAWGVLTFRMPPLPGAERIGRDFFRRQIERLGSPRWSEWAMAAIFTAAALLWFFRVPLRISSTITIPGWGPPAEAYLRWLGADPKLAATAFHDSTVAMTLALLMFCIPAERRPDGRLRFLMDWDSARGLPWDVMLLLGGGFAIANAFSATGLSGWLGQALAAAVDGWHPFLVVFAVALMMTCLTEFTTNVATLYAVMPVLASATVKLGIDPRLTLLPAAISTSCGFMLPAGTPPNAIVMGTGKVTIGAMCRYGFWMNLLGVILVTLTAYGLVVPILGIDIHRMPDWAR